jgi:hypothetical protein
MFTFTHVWVLFPPLSEYRYTIIIIISTLQDQFHYRSCVTPSKCIVLMQILHSHGRLLTYVLYTMTSYQKAKGLLRGRVIKNTNKLNTNIGQNTHPERETTLHKERPKTTT